MINEDDFLTVIFRHENWVYRNLLKFYSITDLRTDKTFLYTTWLPQGQLGVAAEGTTTIECHSMPCNKVVSLSLAECSMGFDLEKFQF